MRKRAEFFGARQCAVSNGRAARGSVVESARLPIWRPFLDERSDSLEPILANVGVRADVESQRLR